MRVQDEDEEEEDEEAGATQTETLVAADKGIEDTQQGNMKEHEWVREDPSSNEDGDLNPDRRVSCTLTSREEAASVRLESASGFQRTQVRLPAQCELF
jgi:hypothetical protein